MNLKKFLLIWLLLGWGVEARAQEEGNYEMNADDVAFSECTEKADEMTGSLTGNNKAQEYEKQFRACLGAKGYAIDDGSDDGSGDSSDNTPANNDGPVHNIANGAMTKIGNLGRDLTAQPTAPAPMTGSTPTAQDSANDGSEDPNDAPYESSRDRRPTLIMESTPVAKPMRTQGTLKTPNAKDQNKDSTVPTNLD